VVCVRWISAIRYPASFVRADATVARCPTVAVEALRFVLREIEVLDSAFHYPTWTAVFKSVSVAIIALMPDCEEQTVLFMATCALHPIEF